MVPTLDTKHKKVMELFPIPQFTLKGKGDCPSVLTTTKRLLNVLYTVPGSGRHCITSTNVVTETQFSRMW